MQRRNNRNKGITLIALVITIIILLILAGISISALTGSGLLGKAEEAKIKYEDEQEHENSMIGEMNNVFDILIEIPTITVINKEEWTGKEGKKVIINKDKNYIVKYTTDGSDPNINNGKEYTGEIIITENCTIKATYIDFKNNIVGKVVTEKIEKIDKQEPIILDIKLEAFKTSINVLVTDAQDANSTEKEEQSGISEYRYKRDNQTWSEWTTDTTYTFNNIYGDLAGVVCTIEVEVRDRAGNIKRVSEIAKTKCLKKEYYTETKRSTYCFTFFK